MYMLCKSRMIDDDDDYGDDYGDDRRDDHDGSNKFDNHCEFASMDTKRLGQAGRFPGWDPCRAILLHRHSAHTYGATWRNRPLGACPQVYNHHHKFHANAVSVVYSVCLKMSIMPRQSRLHCMTVTLKAIAYLSISVTYLSPPSKGVRI